MTIIESEQTRDIRLTQILRGPFVFRYASYRKSEDARLNLRSEDLIVSELTATHALFGLSDGVGSSFYGNIGSQILAETALDWFRTLEPPGKGDLADRNAFLAKLNKILEDRFNKEKIFATRIVQEKELGKESPLVRIAEQTQRDDFGTQANFAGGIVWPKSRALPNGLVILFWLGNARIRIFKNEIELTHLLNWGEDPNQLIEVWSSKDGVIGKIHSYVTDLSEITSVIAYSDGLEEVEERITPGIGPLDLEAIVNAAQAIKDDDVTFLELSTAETAGIAFSDDIVEMVRHEHNVAFWQKDQKEVVELNRKLTEITQKHEDEVLQHQKTKRRLILSWILLALVTVLSLVALCLVRYDFISNLTSTPTSTQIPSPTVELPSPTQTPMPSLTPSVSATPTLTETPGLLQITILAETTELFQAPELSATPREIITYSPVNTPGAADLLIVTP